MPDYFLQSDPERNPNFYRFATPLPVGAMNRRWLLTTLLAEAAECRRHGDHSAALAAETDARRLARVVSR